MMKYLLFVWGWLLPLVLLAEPPLEPLQIAKQFVAPTGWPEMKSYLSGEAAGQARRQSLGQQIPTTLQRHCELLEQREHTAVVAVELRDSVSRNDFYLHFRRDSASATIPWKLAAIRSLGMTQLGPPMLKLLAEMPPAEAAQYNQKHPDASRDFMLGNIQLWIGSDANIAEHFARHQPEFQRAADLVQSRYFTPTLPDTALVRTEQAANADADVLAALRPLYISRVTRRNLGCANCLEFLIGGVTDNTVGLLYQPVAAKVPPMSPNRIIVMKPLGNGWYLYKTT
ncbi:hypothetical protein [Hymenobacter mucosus]|nr:hypothetical protein [Hymenobacter mucosus]